MAMSSTELDQQYIDSLPYRFGPDVVANITGNCTRYWQGHYDELGGMMLGRRVTFFRPTVLAKLGLSRTQDAEA